jgi:hypothetical protein
MVTAEHLTGSDRPAPAGAPAPPAGTGGNVRQAHRTVCRARCAQRDGRTGGSRRRRTSTAHRSPSVSTRRPVAAATDRPLAAHPGRRPVLICLSVTVGVIIGYVLALGILQLNSDARLDWIGLLLIVIGGLVWLNAITVDAVRRQSAGPAGGLRST